MNVSKGRLLPTIPVLLIVGGMMIGCASAVKDPSSLSGRIDRVVANVAQRKLASDKKSPWAIMHAVVAYPSDAVVRDARTGKDVEAIEFILTGAKHEGRSLFQVSEGLLAPPRTKEAEHHPNQFLMIFSLAGVGVDRAISTDDGKRHRVADLVASAKQAYTDDQEPGWTLVALSIHVPFGETWIAENGRTYGVADVVRNAIKRDPREESEGGTHHLFGVAYAFRKVASRNEGLKGVWKETKAYLAKHIKGIRRFQLDDGAFSGGLLKERKTPESPSALAFGTGHTIEWLCFALTPKELREPWVKQAVERLVREIEQHPLDSFSDGAIYHAVHGLKLYQRIAKIK